MRRIYDSEALERDDDEPHSPRERKREYSPQSIRSIDSTVWSDRLLPHRLRRWAITLQIVTKDREVENGSPVTFEVKMKNRLPMPVSLVTLSPHLWTWYVDDHAEASKIQLYDAPNDRKKFRFDRGETKRFRKEWSGMFRISNREWEPADPGEYTIRAAVNVDDAAGAGLEDETTVRLV
jgi:hypothetical protein